MKKLNLKSNMKKSIGVLLTSAAIMAIIPLSASAHCDTMDGPVVVDGKKAMESNNVNYVMKWVAPEYQ
ncbi:LysM domain-containing protein, partial [Listeria monocytogenes]|nr:LysM domain-containing protein [Listeria monocytogenes]